MDNVYSQFLFYANSLWRRRWLAVGVAWIMCLLGWFATALIPDTYTSSGRIYVDTSNTLRPLLEGLAVETDVGAEVRVMQQTLLSRPNLEAVARMTDLDITATTPGEIEKLLDSLHKRTTIRAEQSNLFTISFADADPQLARDVVQALITIFVESNLGQSRTEMDAARRFIDRKISEYSKQLEEAEQRLAVFKQSNLNLLPGQAGYHARLERAEQDLVNAEIDLKDAVTRSTVLRRELETMPEVIESTSEIIGVFTGSQGPPSDVAVRLFEIEKQLDDMLTQYTAKHPDVVRLKRRLAVLEEEMAKELSADGGPMGAAPQAPTTRNTEPNPVFAEVKLRLIQEESDIETLKSRVNRTGAEAVKLRGLAHQVPAVEAELTKLNRDYNIIKANYETLLSRRESAKISQDRETTSEKVQYRLVDPAEVPAFPSGPPRALFLTLVLIAGLGAGVAFAWALVVLDDTFSNTLSMGNDLDRPILGTVSPVVSVASRGRAAASSASMVVVVLSILFAYGALLVVERQVGLGNTPVAEVAEGLTSRVVGSATQTLTRVISSQFDWI